MDTGYQSRSRVAQACDSCKVRKAKCEGGQPCNRCQARGQICVFGSRRLPPRNHPRGYTEMLEQQQDWLIEGLRKLYQRTLDNNCWPGKPLPLDAHGYPLTHEILLRLGVLNNPIEFKEAYDHPEQTDAENRGHGASAPSDVRLKEQIDAGLQTMLPLESSSGISELGEPYTNDDSWRQSVSTASYHSSWQSYDICLDPITIDDSCNNIGGEINEVGIVNAETAVAQNDSNTLPFMFTSTHVQPSLAPLPLSWMDEMDGEDI